MIKIVAPTHADFSADPGLRAVIESWLATYQNVIESAGLSRQGLRRMDPMPRLAVLVDAGVLSDDHQAITSLKASFETALHRSAD